MLKFSMSAVRRHELLCANVAGFISQGTIGKKSVALFCIQQHEVSVRPAQEGVQPFSAIPTIKQHWLIQSLVLLLTKGGLQKSLFKVQENGLR